MQETIYMVGESYLAYKEKRMASVNIKNSESITSFIRDIWHPDISIIERFLSINLNRANNIISYHWISQGGLAGTIFDTRIILKSALESLACSIILAHNHPSGNTTPSSADLTITSKITKSAEIMEIKVLDHIILTPDSYYSMADHGHFD